MGNKIFFILVVFTMLCGCSASSGNPGTFIRVAEYPVEFLFPGDWAKTTNENPYNLQCFSGNEQMMTGVFVYEESEMMVPGDPKRQLDFHIDDIRSKRANVTPVENVMSTRGEETGQTTAVYSGEKDGETYYYRFTLIEFDHMPEIIAIVIQTTFPDQWKKTGPILEKITRSARIVKPSGA